MMNFLVDNIATIIVGAIVLTVTAAIAVKLIRDKRQHKSSCGCNCEGCPSAKKCDRK